MKRFIFSTMVMALLIGCGGGGSSNKKNDTNQSSIFNNNSDVSSIYDYAKDTTALRKLNNKRVNSYKDIEEKLKKATDEKSFNIILNQFITEVLFGSVSTDKILSYAPRGKDRSLIVDVKNGKIDYTKYTIKGDINDDYSVDMKDVALMKTALFNNDVSYDVNGDEKLDLTDLVYLLARLNSEIKYFDFYDTKYQKLPLARRSVDDSKVVDYSGKLTQIVVVAKDENGASGFSDTLSDIDKVWYKKSGWKYSESRLISESNPLISSKIFELKDNSSVSNSASRMVLRAVRAVTQITPDPYLTGWHFDIKFVETGGFDGFGETGIDQFSWAIKQGKDKIDSHFRKTNMGSAGKKSQSLTEYVYHIGSTSGKSNEVKADDISYVDAYTLDGEKVTIKRVVHASSVLYESSADKTLKGRVNAPVTLKGSITAKRKGPSPKEDDFTGTVKDNKVEIKKIPFGDYSFSMKTECQCKIDLGNFIYDSKSAQTNFNLDANKVKATVTIDVVDSQMVPLENKTVKIEQMACLDQGSGSSSAIFSENAPTDDLGEVKFENMPIGDYKLSVDGKYIRTIHFCQNSSERVILNPKWYLKYSANAIGVPFETGYMIVKGFEYKCDKETGSPLLGKNCTMVYNDSDDVTIEYGGSFSKSNLAPLEIDEHSLQANYHIPNIGSGKVLFMSSQANGTFNGYTCAGKWNSSYSNKLKNGVAFNITESSDAGTCKLEFKPCTDNLCK